MLQGLSPPGGITFVTRTRLSSAYPRHPAVINRPPEVVNAAGNKPPEPRSLGLVAQGGTEAAACVLGCPKGDGSCSICRVATSSCRPALRPRSASAAAWWCRRPSRRRRPTPPSRSSTYKVGAVEVTAIYDGIWEKPHDPAFITNASVDDVKAAMVKAGLPAEFVSIPFTVVVVKNGGKTIVCDSGTGGQVQPTAGKLTANMKAAGIDPGQDRHHPDLALPSRSHLRADGEGHQQAGLSRMPRSSSRTPNTSSGPTRP